MHDTNTITPVRNDSDASQAFILANISLMVFIIADKILSFFPKPQRYRCRVGGQDYIGIDVIETGFEFVADATV